MAVTKRPTPPDDNVDVPPELATVMVNELLAAGLDPDMRVLVPNIGRGSLVPALQKEQAKVLGMEHNPKYFRPWSDAPDAVPVLQSNFLTWLWPERDQYRFVCMAAPLRDDLGTVYAKRAWDYMLPGARMVALIRVDDEARSTQAWADFVEWLRPLPDCELVPQPFPVGGHEVGMLVADKPMPRVRSRSAAKT